MFRLMNDEMVNRSSGFRKEGQNENRSDEIRHNGQGQTERTRSYETDKVVQAGDEVRQNAIAMQHNVILNKTKLPTTTVKPNKKNNFF